MGVIHDPYAQQLLPASCRRVSALASSSKEASGAASGGV
jgi:hypothetical protein